MTAPQSYSVLEEKESVGNVKQEQDRPESLHEQIDAAVLELYILAGSLGTVGELMLGADTKFHSADVGTIIEHYTGLISDGLGRIEGFLTSDMRREAND